MVVPLDAEQPAGQGSPRATRGFRGLAVFATLTLVACASPPPTPDEPARVEPPPPTQIYFYPTKGQSAAQQDRDLYECYLWAKRQTGSDPTAGQLAPTQ